MRIKLGVLLLLAVIVVASAGMGISYADGGIELGQVPSCYCDVAFTSAGPGIPPDNEGGIDVGYIGTVTLDPSGSSINIDIFNAYPGYKAYIDFTVKNLGNKPINVNMVASDYEDTALDIEVAGVEEGDVLGVGESLDGTVTVGLLQGAEQNTVYGFTVSFGFYNEECPQYTYVETVVVDANDQIPTTSSAILENGVEYTLVATGTAYAGDTIDFDAKYSITHRISGDTWTDKVSGYESYETKLLNLLVDGVEVDWGDFNWDHKYECTITGDGTKVDLLIYDICYPNNAGSLTVNIYKIIP